MRILLLILALPFITNAQSLSPERVKMIKDATVKVIVDSGKSTGTGFFINENGALLTCWHVISRFIVVDSKNIITVKNLFIKHNDGSIIEYKLPRSYSENIDLFHSAIAYDVCQLIPTKLSTRKFKFLKLGSINDCNEGDDIYTCGYPVDFNIPFISKGIISTKYSDSAFIFQNGVKIKNMPLSQKVLMDITLNRGNSGGAIIRIGKTANEDTVIGFADFISSPFGEKAQQIFDLSNGSGIDIGSGNGFSMMGSIKLLSQATTYVSNGISGCIAIDHFLEYKKAIVR